MLRSLFSGISGLRAHQQMMDVTGNNIANVNTAGYKSSQAVFQDTLSQLLKTAGSAQNGNGGSNPAQIGLGVKLAGIGINFGQGAAQTTGRSTDLMINGDGFFVVKSAGEQIYTRAGSLSFDANGALIDPQGGTVQGWQATNGVLSTNATPTDVHLPTGYLLPPVATTAVTMSGNLPADSTSTTPVMPSIVVYDQQGVAKTLTVSFTKVNSTNWTATVSDGTTTSAAVPIAFAPDGSTPNPTTLAFGGITVDVAGLTSDAGSSSVAPQSQNGSTLGMLQAFTISPVGTIIGVFSNGLKQPIAQIAMASFNNPGGLERAGNTDFRTTVNSGPAQIGTAGSAGRGTLQNGALEMSNVDLAGEFTSLIIAQRGFQANSKVIITSDEMLQDLVNLKR